MELGLNWYQIGNKTCIPKVIECYKKKKISMLTSLRRSPLACKCVFYRPEYNGDPIELNFEALQKEK